MKPLILICLFAMLGGGLVAGTLLFAAPASVTPEPIAASPADLPGDDALRAEVAALSERMDSMAMTLDTLHTRLAELGDGGGTRVAADAVRQGELDELRDLLAAVRDPETGSEQLESLVLNVLEAKEDRERAERDERRREALEARLDERLADLTEKLGLNTYQAGELKRVLTSEQEARDTFFAEMRETGTWDREAMRDGMEEIRTTTRTELQTVLSAGQYEQYVEQDTGFGSFGGFGGRRGGGDDGGGTRGR